MLQELNESDQQALGQALDDKVFCIAFKKFCQNAEESNTRKVREYQNNIPKSLDEECERKAYMALHGGIAEAYRNLYKAFEKAAGR